MSTKEQNKKVCSKCKEEKPLTSEYYPKRKKGSVDGFRNECKACTSKRKRELRENYREYDRNYSKTYHEKNEEKMIKYYEQYKVENKERIKEYSKKYYEENKEQLARYKKKWYRDNPNYDKIHYEKNKERRKAHNKQYFQENKHLFRQAAQRRRALERNLLNTLTVEQWSDTKIHFNNSCAYCGMTKEEHVKTFSGTLHQEHFIAVSNGGGYTHDNIIPSCKSCNTSKSNKDFFEWYPEQEFYCKEREKLILEYLGYMKGAKQLVFI